MSEQRKNRLLLTFRCGILKSAGIRQDGMPFFCSPMFRQEQKTFSDEAGRVTQ